MFRESDYKPYVPHSTYKTKPLPGLQLQSQIGKFDEKDAELPNSARCAATTSDPMPRAVPSSNDFFYDPSHPEADWSGMVSMRHNQRRHESGHISQKSNIAHAEGGIVSIGRDRDFSNKKRDDRGRVGDSNGCPIGGIDSTDHWRTTYMGLAESESTSRSQLTLQKRSLPRKAIIDPAQAQSRSSENDMYAIHSARSQESSFNPTRNVVNTNRSFIANLGASLVTKIAEPDLTPDASQQTLSKTLLTQNYNPTPGNMINCHSMSYESIFICIILFSGYTGRRTLG